MTNIYKFILFLLKIPSVLFIQSLTSSDYWQSFAARLGMSASHKKESFNTGPLAIYGAFNHYGDVWFFKKKTVKITKKVTETNFLLKYIIKYIFSQVVIFM